MKICITGKGGSGKSMISVLLAQSLAAKGYSILLVDADESNFGLQRMLGISTESKPFLEYLGGKPAIQKKMIASFSSGLKEPGMEILPQKQISVNEIPLEYIAKTDHIQLLRIGKIELPQEGCACPMGALVRDFLFKLILKEREVVIADHEAGLEHFGRGVESGADLVIVIVEPSFESILVAEKIKNLSTGLGTRVVVILNKVTPDVEPPLRDELSRRGLSVTNAIAYDSVVFEACLKGQPLLETQAQKQISALADALGL